MNLVVKGLYIGSKKDALNMEKLHANDIKYILSVTDASMPKYKHIKHKQIFITDGNIPIVEYFGEVFRYPIQSHIDSSEKE